MESLLAVWRVSSPAGVALAASKYDYNAIAMRTIKPKHYAAAVRGAARRPAILGSRQQRSGSRQVLLIPPPQQQPIQVAE